MAIALVVAAGRGERLGYGMPKALVPLAGRPMLQWSLEALRGVPDLRAIVVALPPEALGEAPQHLFAESGGACRLFAVAGGACRSASVREALRAAPAVDPAAGRGSGEEAVIVHDAARPLATGDLFERAIRELLSTSADAVVAASAVSDTIKEAVVEGMEVLRTHRRERLWAVQTPQVFLRSALSMALEAASEAELEQATDDAGLVEARGGTVRLLRSSPLNFKVTTALDLRVADLLLTERNEQRIG